MGGRRTGNLGRNWCGLGGFRVTRRHLSLVSGCAFGWGGAIPVGIGSFDAGVDFGAWGWGVSGGRACQVGALVPSRQRLWCGCTISAS